MGPAGGRERVAERFRLFVATDCDLHTPLYSRLGAGISQDTDLLDLLATAQPGQARPVLLLAAIHSLVLAEPDSPAARWYPSVTGRPVPAGDPFPDVRQFSLERGEAIAHLVATRSTQTNEANRSVAWLAGARHATSVAHDDPERPLVLVELGHSAGLNLLFDRYAAEVVAPDGTTTIHGDPAAAVRLRTELRGPGRPDMDSPLPPVARRIGIDLAPLDLDDADSVRWLEACIWPDQPGRLDRFRDALTVVRAEPPEVVVGDALEQLPAVVRGIDPEHHVVVLSSWAITYLERSRRQELDQAVSALSADRRMTWLTVEAPGVVPSIEAPVVADDASAEDRFASVLGCTSVVDGRRTDTRLARCHPHLTWLEWGA